MEEQNPTAMPRGAKLSAQRLQLPTADGEREKLRILREIKDSHQVLRHIPTHTSQANVTFPPVPCGVCSKGHLKGLSGWDKSPQPPAPN